MELGKLHLGLFSRPPGPFTFSDRVRRSGDAAEVVLLDLNSAETCIADDRHGIGQGEET